VSQPPPDPLEARLVELAVAHLDVDPNRLRPDALLGEDLGVDSLAALELGMVLEDEFGIELPDDVLADVLTYGDLVAAVRSRVLTAQA
jgi:acyl carrier protein